MFMRMKSIFACAALLALAISANGASAGVLTVSSYSMLNGDGTPEFGDYNYWDQTYNGVGAVTTSHAPLSGGTGALTDGVIAANNFDKVSSKNTPSANGSSQYVGWKYFDPTITFNLAGSQNVKEIDIYVDNPSY